MNIHYRVNFKFLQAKAIASLKGSRIASGAHFPRSARILADGINSLTNLRSLAFRKFGAHLKRVIDAEPKLGIVFLRIVNGLRYIGTDNNLFKVRTNIDDSA